MLSHANTVEQKISPEEMMERKANLLAKLHTVFDVDELLSVGLAFLAQPESNETTIRSDETAADPIQRMNTFQEYRVTHSHIPEVKALNVIDFTLELKNKFETKSVRFFNVVFPGAFECTKWLSLLGIHSSYYSAAIHERNVRYVELFLEGALGEMAKDKTTSVFSRERCEKCDYLALLKLKREYGLPLEGFLKKDLKTVSDNLDHTILIDNDLCNIFPGQAKNALNTFNSTVIEDFCVNFDDKSISIEHLLKLNNIFAIVGVLKTAIDMTVENGIPFLDNLFSLQFDKMERLETTPLIFPAMKEFYRPVKFNSVDRFSYYEMGLKELQKVNPALRFYGHDLLYALQKTCVDGKGLQTSHASVVKML